MAKVGEKHKSENSASPAFPTEDFQRHGNSGGLNKREYFAACALQGLLSSHVIDLEVNHDWLRETTKTAVDYADMLLIQLEK